MKITVVMDGRFEWQDGRAYSSHMAYSPFSTRFLAVFSEVEIVARAYDKEIPSGYPVDGPNSKFLRVPTYKGTKQFLSRLPKIFKLLWQISGRTHPVLLYLPGTLPFILAFMMLARRRALYCLIVADPEDQLSPEAMHHPLRAVARSVFSNCLRYIAGRSAGVMYVTSEHLQRKYPAKSGRSFGTSDVFIPEDAFLTEPRLFLDFQPANAKLVYVAMMSQAYKAHDDLLTAFAEVRQQWPNIQLTLVGDGQLRPSLEKLAADLGIHDNITFTGKVAHGPQLTEVLDSSDLFVMPSRAEGLPRVIVEAMARGLPAVSTDVGGISELIPPDYLVRPNDAHEFAQKIKTTLSDRSELALMSQANLKTASQFTPEIVNSKISAFYSFIIEHSK